MVKRPSKRTLQIKYPEIGVCGLSCRLCPLYQTVAKSRCGGCKSEPRMAVGCAFITCAVKKKGIEFCWDCEEGERCERWKKHKEFGKKHDSFKCYQKLEDDVAFVQKNGIKEFERLQKEREKLLRDMLQNFNEGRSKSYYCIAATVMEIEEVKDALTKAKRQSASLGIRDKSAVLHSMLDGIATQKGYLLKLRK
jgi:ACT domain-containing protein